MLTIPRQILRAPLMARGGYVVLAGLFPSSTVAALRDEAARQREFAQHVEVRRSDAELVRGGDPARRFLNAPGGEVQQACYMSPDLQDALEGIIGLPVVPTGSGGTFSYYCRPGDFLTIHRDIVTCDVAVITCVEDEGAVTSGGKLCVYPGRVWEGLPEIRRDPARGAIPVRLAPGETAVLFGGVVPHCTLPVAAGQSRVVSLLCYRAAIN
jgi:hypothetical protein